MTIEENLQNLVNQMNKQYTEARSKEMFTLGDLIKELKKYNTDSPIIIKPFDLIPTNFDSYRGYYTDLALGYEISNNAMTVGSLLKQAEEAVGKTFTGYKGGEFKMTENTPVWVSNYGECSDMAIGSIEELYCYVVINCYEKGE